MFRAIFCPSSGAKTEIFTAYGILQRWIYKKLCSFLCDVVLINVINIGGCVVLCLGIGVCMLMYVVHLVGSSILLYLH